MKNINIIHTTASGIKISWPHDENQFPGMDCNPSIIRELLQCIYDEATTLMPQIDQPQTVELELKPDLESIPNFVFDVINAIKQYFGSFDQLPKTTTYSAEIFDEHVLKGNIPLFIGTMKTKDLRWKCVVNPEKAICVGTHPLVDVRAVIGASSTIRLDRFDEDRAQKALDKVRDLFTMSNPNVDVSLLNSVFYTHLTREVPLVFYYCLNEIGPLELRRRILSVRDISDIAPRLVLLPVLRDDLFSLLDQVEHVSSVLAADPNSPPPIFVSPNEDVLKVEQLRWDLCRIYANVIFLGGDHDNNH